MIQRNPKAQSNIFRRKWTRMIDAANYDKIEALKNGMRVRIRSIRPDDKHRLAEAFKNLDPESIYTRFFHHKKMLTDEELKSATEIDFENAVALVVTTGEGAHEDHHRGRSLRCDR